jgi:catechol-2,3-dioxygenase
MMVMSHTTSTPTRDRAHAAQEPMPVTCGLFEMVLEVADLTPSERFYHEVIGLSIADRWTDERRAVWLAIGREGFLGLWPRGDRWRSRHSRRPRWPARPFRASCPDGHAGRGHGTTRFTRLPG